MDILEKVSIPLTVMFVVALAIGFLVPFPNVTIANCTTTILASITIAALMIATDEIMVARGKKYLVLRCMWIASFLASLLGLILFVSRYIILEKNDSTGINWAAVMSADKFRIMLGIFIVAIVQGAPIFFSYTREMGRIHQIRNHEEDEGIRRQKDDSRRY